MAPVTDRRRQYLTVVEGVRRLEAQAADARHEARALIVGRFFANGTDRVKCAALERHVRDLEGLGQHDDAGLFTRGLLGAPGWALTQDGSEFVGPMGCPPPGAALLIDPDPPRAAGAGESSGDGGGDAPSSDPEPLRRYLEWCDRVRDPAYWRVCQERALILGVLSLGPCGSLARRNALRLGRRRVREAGPRRGREPRRSVLVERGRAAPRLRPAVTARAAIRTWTVGPTVRGAACLTAKQRARLALLTDRRDRARAARPGAKADLRRFVERLRRRRLELIGRVVVRRVERASARGVGGGRPRRPRPRDRRSGSARVPRRQGRRPRGSWRLRSGAGSEAVAPGGPPGEEARCGAAVEEGRRRGPESPRCRRRFR